MSERWLALEAACVFLLLLLACVLGVATLAVALALVLGGGR